MIEEQPPYRLASLVHDVGKLRTRIGEDASGDEGHANTSASFVREYVDAEAVATLVEHHEDEDVTGVPEDLVSDLLVVKASNELATPTDAPGKTSRRLQSVFGLLSENEEEEFREDRKRARETSNDEPGATYPLKPLRIDRDVIFPRDGGHDRSIDEGYRHLWNGLTDAMPSNPGYETLVSLLEAYAWCVPANVETPRLPLYDHLRTTAAVADALTGGDQDGPRGVDRKTLQAVIDGEPTDDALFTLVKGDISGIQSFIHRIRSPDEADTGAAKRLRGRSTQLWLLDEGLARLFVRRLNLPITSLIWNEGGQFYALVPADSDDQIQAFVKEVNEWLLDRFDADLFFVTGSATATGAHVEFDALFRRAASDANQAKLTKGSGALAARGTAVFEERTEPCKTCGGEKSKEKSKNSNRCVECTIQADLGSTLPTSRYVCLDFSHPSNSAPDFEMDLPKGGLSWRLEPEPANADILYSLNSTELVRETDNRALPAGVGDVGSLFTGATVPHGGGVNHVWPFTDVRQLGRGDSGYLHVAKMDIDGLGAAIDSGMKGGPSRLAALSRSLELFFAGYSNELAKQQAYYRVPDDNAIIDSVALDETDQVTVAHRLVDQEDGDTIDERYVSPENDQLRARLAREADEKEAVTAISPIYVGFAGGDDMFFVGPWDEAVEFGRTVREEFDTYTGEELHLSGGFLLTGATTPIARSIETAERLLEDAKDLEYESGRKNAVTLFGETLRWKRDGEPTPGMLELIKTGKTLAEHVENDNFSRTLLHKLITIREEARDDRERSGGDGLSKDYHWKLKYTLARNVDEELVPELEVELDRSLPWIQVPVSWAALKTR